MRSILGQGRTVLLALLASGALTTATAQNQPDSTYRVILFIADKEGTRELSFQRLDEVVGESDGPEKLRDMLKASSIQRLEDVTILPGRDTPALRIGNVTVRVKGIYKEPRRDAMFLRIEVDGGQEAFVKEVVSRFDESIVLAYPLAEGSRSIIALIVPTRLSP